MDDVTVTPQQAFEDALHERVATYTSRVRNRDDHRSDFADEVRTRGWHGVRIHLELFMENDVRWSPCGYVLDEMECGMCLLNALRKTIVSVEGEVGAYISGAINRGDVYGHGTRLILIKGLTEWLTGARDDLRRLEYLEEAARGAEKSKTSQDDVGARQGKEQDCGERRPDAAGEVPHGNCPHS